MPAQPVTIAAPELKQPVAASIASAAPVAKAAAAAKPAAAAAKAGAAPKQQAAKEIKISAEAEAAVNDIIVQADGGTGMVAGAVEKLGAAAASVAGGIIKVSGRGGSLRWGRPAPHPSQQPCDDGVSDWVCSNRLMLCCRRLFMSVILPLVPTAGQGRGQGRPAAPAKGQRHQEGVRSQPPSPLLLMCMLCQACFSLHLAALIGQPSVPLLALHIPLRLGLFRSLETPQVPSLALVF